MSDVIIISGSNNKNLELSKSFEKALTQKDVSNRVIDLVSLGLPMYTPLEERNGVPELVHKYVDILSKAKGYIFVTPEYNGGLPPVVTNLIAWVSRNGDADWRKTFNLKPAAVASFSGSGGILALVSLRTQLSYIGMNVIGRQVRGTYKDEVNLDDVTAVTEALINNLKI